MEKLLQKLLIASNVLFIENEQLNMQLLSHPDYGSLRAVTDTLDYFGIENVAANVPKDTLEQLPNVFMALIEYEENSEMVLVKKKKNKIELIQELTKKKVLSEDAFKNMWTGTLIAIEPDKEIKKVFKRKFRSREIILALTIVLILFTSIIGIPILVENIGFSILAILGLVLSIFAVREEIGMHSKTVAKVCGAISNNSGCAEIIKNTEIKFLNVLGLSDVSISYFMGVVVVLFFVGYQHTTLFVFTLLTIPATLFALYFQGVKLRSWCVLCLAISGVLTIQLIWLSYQFIKWDFLVGHILKSAVVMTLVLTAWFYVKPLITNSLKLKESELAFMKFKRIGKVIGVLFSGKEVKTDVSIPLFSQISFGNKNSKIKITAVTNPFCGYCTEAFVSYEKLMKYNSDLIQLDFIFLTPPNVEHPAVKIVLRIIELYYEDPEKSFEALRNWFSYKDIKNFYKQFGEPIASQNYMKIINEHISWCEYQEINYTPVTLINNQYFPQEYDHNDLPMFIEYLQGKVNEKVPVAS